MKIVINILFFLSSFIMVSVIDSYASGKPAHYYIQYNAMFNLGTSVHSTITSVTTNNGQQVTTTANFIMRDSLFDPFYNTNFMLGYHFNNSFAAELEIASYNFYFSQVNGRPARSADRLSSVFTATYNMFNIRYEVLEWGDFNLFLKGGVGFGIFDATARNDSGGNDIEFAYQGVMGVYYEFSRFLDAEISYKLMRNLATKEFIAATSVEQAHVYTESSLYLGLRFKLNKA